MSAGPSKLVLVIDDDEDVLDAMRLVLGAEGYDVRCANGGVTALIMLGEGLVPALIISDIMMPDLSGWDVLKALRADTELSHVPVVLTTASFLTSSPRGVDVLEKPFSLDELLDVVSKYCPRPPDGDVPDESHSAVSSQRRIRAA